MDAEPNNLILQVEEALSIVDAQRETRTDKLLVMRVPREKLAESLRVLTRRLGVKHLSTITGLDGKESLELNYQFWSGSRIITIKTTVPKNDPQIDTCTPIIPGAVLYEMEVHDMFGVSFQGHPWTDRKLLLPDNYPSDMPPPLLKETSSTKIRKAVGIEK